MDKQQVTGIVLCLLVVMGFSIYNTPSQEQIERQKFLADSIAQVQQQKLDQEMKKAQQQVVNDSIAKANPDSAKAIYGDFAACMVGDAKSVVLENDLLRLDLSSKGGTPNQILLKQFQTYSKQPLVLVDGKDQKFNFELAGASGMVNTEDLYFAVEDQTPTSVTFKACIGNGFLAYTYRLNEGSYLVDFDVTTANLKGSLKSQATTRLDWRSKISAKEKSATFETRYAELSYKFYGDSDIDNLSAVGNDDDEISDPLHWVAFKDQYFSAALIAETGKPIAASKLKSVDLAKAKDDKYVKDYAADLQLGFDVTENGVNKLRFFFGPNKYKMLSGYDDDLSGDDRLYLKKLVPLGWALFRWVNQLIVIPLFSLLASFLTNYGLIIFLLTLIIKLILMPFTYKSYLSSAKMRVLKPEIERLQSKIPEENTMERQQVPMQVYSKAGVNPMGGCLPMLCSMPILIAMFTFFPTAIELRGQSFLWAEDLSAYDSICDFGFSIPFYGDHISLFCLLMTVVNIVYTKFNMQMTDTGAQQQMPMMKYMMYFMPFMFLFMFNDYASGLTYYYFVSLLITIVQTVGIRYMVNDEEVLRKINEKVEKKKSSNSKSWMQRLAEMQEEQKRLMEEQQKKNK